MGCPCVPDEGFHGLDGGDHAAGLGGEFAEEAGEFGVADARGLLVLEDKFGGEQDAAEGLVDLVGGRRGGEAHAELALEVVAQAGLVFPLLLSERGEVGLGGFADGDVDHNAFPDGSAGGVGAGDRFDRDPAGAPPDHDAAFPEEGFFFSKNFGVEPVEGGALVGVHGVEGEGGVCEHLLAAEVEHGQPAFAEEGEAGRASGVEFQHIGAHRDVSREFVGGALQFFPCEAKIFLGLAAGGDVYEGHKQHVVKQGSADDDIATGAVFGYDMDFHGRHDPIGVCGLGHGGVPDFKDPGAVFRIRVGPPSPCLHGGDVTERVAEGSGECLVEKSDRAIIPCIIECDGNGNVVEDFSQAGLTGREFGLGDFAAGDVGEHALPHDGSVGEVAWNGLRMNPAGHAICDHAAFLGKGNFFLKTLCVFAHPLGVVLGVHASEGVEGIFLGRLALEPAQFEKAGTHEGKLRHGAARGENHGVGAHGDVFGDFVGGALEFLARGHQFPLGGAALSKIGECDLKRVSEDGGVEEGVAQGAVFGGDLEFHRLDSPLHTDRAGHGIVPFSKNLAAVGEVGIGEARPVFLGGDVVLGVAEGGGELPVQEKHPRVFVHGGDEHGQRKVFKRSPRLAAGGGICRRGV